MSAAATAALIAGVACGLAPLAQAIRIRVKRSSEDVSLLWLSLYACGALVWLLYGVGEASLPLIVSQAVALTSVTIALGLAVRARLVIRRPHPRAPRPGRAAERRAPRHALGRPTPGAPQVGPRRERLSAQEMRSR